MRDSLLLDLATHIDKSLNGMQWAHRKNFFTPTPAIAKNYHPVSLFSVVSEVFENLANNRLVVHLKKCGIFSHF